MDQASLDRAQELRDRMYALTLRLAYAHGDPMRPEDELDLRIERDELQAQYDTLTASNP